MFYKLMSMRGGWQLPILRIVLGFIFLPHGLKKTFRIFHGAGFAATMHGFTDRVLSEWMRPISNERSKISFAIKER